MTSKPKQREHVEAAEKLAAENGGLLPRPSALLRSRPALQRYIYKNPAAFAHIPRSPAERPGEAKRARHLEEAERLAGENGGLLPRSKDLLRIDPRLAWYVYRHPAEFARLRPPRPARRTKARTVSEWVAAAREAAAANGGLLPRPADLDPNLVFAMRQHPRLFASFETAPRTRRHQAKIDARVREAEALARATGPLKLDREFRAAHPSLNFYMTRYPEEFASVPRVRRERRAR